MVVKSAWGSLMRESMIPTAALPMLWLCMCMVVREGEKILDSEESSKPQILISSGTLIPRSWQVLITSIATKSLAQMKTWGSGSISISLSLKKFKNILSFIKLEDKELYNLYEQKALSIKQKNYRNMTSICKEIIDYINNGILENGAVRSFDLLDYYHITKCDRTTILKILKETSPKDVKIYGAFLRRYQNSKLLNESQVEEILNSKQTIGIEFDKNNNPILGTGYIVTQEEKENIFNYLKENNIPLYDDVYNIALKRYLNKNLIIKTKNIK